MASCDDLYNRIQQLQEKKRRYDEAASYVYSAAEEAPDPSRVFVTKTRDGKQIEVDFDELWSRAMADPATREWALKAAEREAKPVGSDGYFENLGQLVDRLGFDDAVTTAAFLQKLTGNWAKSDPVDFNMITARNSGEAWDGMVSQAFMEAGIDADDRLVQAVTLNSAPFLDILNKQTKLRVFDFVARNNLQKRITEIQDFVKANGVGATTELKKAFANDYRKAMYAHRSARLASRRSGQLLQNYKRWIDDGGIIPVTVTDLSDPKAQKRLNDMMVATTGESSQELVQMTEKTIGATTAEMVSEGSLIRKVLEAADKGQAGLKELEEIQETLNLEGMEAFGEDPLDDGWDKVWKRHARAGYKDTVLFNPKTQLQANYLSQKLVFLTEGYITATSQGFDLYSKRQQMKVKETQLGTTPDADTELPTAPINGIKITPFADGFTRDVMKAQLDGLRIAGKAALIAEDVIRQSWKETLRKSFLGGETPFSGNVDNFANKGMLSIEDQYRVAESVLQEPMSKNPAEWPMQLRNKLHHSLKVLGNKGVEKLGGPRLPVYSSLQMMSAVDQRAGLRNYMTIRANDLMIDAAAANPEGTLKEWADVAAKQMEDQLYQAEPTAQNIADAREQFNLSKEELTDDEVAAYIVGNAVGAPVLNTPERAVASRRATEMRMQGEVTGFMKDVDQALRPLRRTELGDSVVPFWRSPANQMVWDVTLGTAPITAAIKTLQIAGLAVRGKDVPTELLVKAQAAWFTSAAMLTLFAALDSQGLIEGGGPLEPTARKLYRERLAAEGKVPNSILGIPFPMGGIPILNTLFLYKDMKEVIGAGNVSEWDQQNAAWGVVSLLAGTILRMPGFAQVEQAFEIFSSQSPEKVQQFLAFWGNAQYNPVSGGERLGEWATGTQSSSLMRPNRLSQAEKFRLEDLEDGHPLRSQWNALRDWTYYSNPGVSYWLGAQPKEKTSLGRDVRRPDGLFQGELPIGVPGIWEFNKGDYFVETQMEMLGISQVPAQIMNGELQGVSITEPGRRELNALQGSIRDERGFEKSSRKHLSGLVYRTPQLDFTQPGGPPEKAQGFEFDVTGLMNRVTKGKTYREAMNALFRSKEWEAWRTNMATTWDPQVLDLPLEMRRNRIGPFLAQAIKDHYFDIASEQWEVSDTESAQQWRKDKEILRSTEQKGATLIEALESAIP